MEEKLKVEGEIKSHLEKITLEDAESTCNNDGNERFWSNTRFLYSSEGMDPEFTLNISNDSKTTLLHISSDDKIESEKFCVGDWGEINVLDSENFVNGVFARGCM